MTSFQLYNLADDTLLYESENEEMAFRKAIEFENIGLEVKWKSLAISTSLIKALGASDEDIQQHEQDLLNELQEHPTNQNMSTCCRT